MKNPTATNARQAEEDSDLVGDVDEQQRTEALLAGEKLLLEMVATGCSFPEVLDALCLNRVTTLGALTASIAHEVNQPLAGIMTNASTCLRMLANDPPNIDGACETARRTIRDVNRASEVIARLRALFGKQAPVSEAVHLNDATQEVLSVTPAMTAKTALEKELS